MGTRIVREYLDEAGRSPFARWFASLGAIVAAKVATALYRLEQGNLSNVKSAGKSVVEFRINYGPGYRVYFGQDGATLIILLGGGSKKSQPRDIKAAHRRWSDYRSRENSARNR